MDGNVYAGGAGNTSYVASVPIEANDSVAVAVTFQPTLEQYDASCCGCVVTSTTTPISTTCS